MSKYSQEGFTLTLLIVIVSLLVLISAGGLALKTVNTSSPTPPSKDNLSSSWKTYQNAEGYSVSYPSNYKLSTKKADGYIDFEITVNDNKLTFYKPAKILESETIEAYIDPPGLGPETVENKYTQEISGIKAHWIEARFHDEIPSIMIGIEFPLGKVLKVVANHISDTNKDMVSLKQFADEIIPTFKFDNIASPSSVINQAIDKTDIKIKPDSQTTKHYKSSYGFEFDYPDNWSFTEEKDQFNLQLIILQPEFTEPYAGPGPTIFVSVFDKPYQAKEVVDNTEAYNSSPHNIRLDSQLKNLIFRKNTTVKGIKGQREQDFGGIPLSSDTVNLPLKNKTLSISATTEHYPDLNKPSELNLSGRLDKMLSSLIIK